jgi:hypothetical protein
VPDAVAAATCVEIAAWVAAPGAFGLLDAAGLPVAGVVAVASGALAVGAALATAVRLGSPAGATRGSGDLVEGWRLVARVPSVRRPMELAAVSNLLYGFLVVALVVLTHGADGEHPRLGVLNAALTVGALGAMLLARGLVVPDRTGLVLPLSLAGFGGAVLGSALLGLGSVPAVGLLLVAGAATLLTEVGAATLLERAVPGAVLARVLGTYDQVNVGALALGSLLVGPAAALLGARVALCGVATLSTVLALPALVRAARSRALGFSPCPQTGPDTSSSFLPSTSRAAVPSSSSKGLPAQRRPSGTLSTQH